MQIAIIGAGSAGATLGRAWIKHGEDVIWGVRNPADPKHAALPKERVKAPAEAIKEAEVVVIVDRRKMREEIAHPVATPGDIEDELRHLIAVVRA